MKLNVRYFAALRSARGIDQEVVETTVKTARELYRELSTRHRLSLREDLVCASVNCEMKDLDAEINEGDEVVFIPPVAGG